MGQIFHGLFLLAAVLFPFVAMRLMWRRMKRVRDEAYRARPASPPPAEWEESVASRDGLTVKRVNQPNDELIALGDRARHDNWPINTP